MPNKLEYKISDFELNFLKICPPFLGYKGKKRLFVKWGKKLNFDIPFLVRILH